MKILIDTRVLNHKNYTGVENYTKNILDILTNKQKNTVEIKPKLTNKYLSHLWTHFILPFKQGDILFSPSNIAPIFIPKNKKSVVTIHDVAFITQADTFSKFFRWYYNFMIPFTIKRADKIITVSQSSKNEIIKYYPYAKDKVEVIYLGVTKKYKILDNIKKEDQILYVGSLNKRKNFIGVIKAFEKIKFKNFKLIIVGNFSSNFNIDEKTNQILKDAKLNKNITFLSNIDENKLITLYNSSKLSIFPSFYEGFGLPVLESMACGTSVICSHISSLPEVGGDAVIYCDPFNIDDIKEKIELLLSDAILRNTMVKKGTIQASKFSWDNSAKNHINIFDKVQK